MTISRTATVPSVRAINLRERSSRMVNLVIRFFFLFGSLAFHWRSDAAIPVSSKERQQSAFQEKVMTEPRDLTGNQLTILSHNEDRSWFVQGAWLFFCASTLWKMLFFSRYPLFWVLRIEQLQSMREKPIKWVK